MLRPASAPRNDRVLPMIDPAVLPNSGVADRAAVAGRRRRGGRWCGSTRPPGSPSRPRWACRGGRPCLGTEPTAATTKSHGSTQPGSSTSRCTRPSPSSRCGWAFRWTVTPLLSRAETREEPRTSSAARPSRPRRRSWWTSTAAPTSPHVYAAGDCCAIRDPLFGTYRWIDHWRETRSLRAHWPAAT